MNIDLSHIIAQSSTYSSDFICLFINKMIFFPLAYRIVIQYYFFVIIDVVGCRAQVNIIQNFSINPVHIQIVINDIHFVK